MHVLPYYILNLVSLIYSYLAKIKILSNYFEPTLGLDNLLNYRTTP